jgi:hypothetical protein
VAYRTGRLPTSPKVTPYVLPQVIVTQFQAGNGFTFTAADGSSTVNDTSNFVIGSQCAKLVTAGAGATTFLLHKGLPAVDMTGKQFVVVIEVDDLTHISSGTLAFLAGSGASSNTSYQWQLASGGTIDQNLIQAGLWIYCTLSFADATVNGSPVKTALTDFYVKVNDDNTGNKVTVRVNAIYAVPDASGTAASGGQGYPDGVVSICFDDGFTSQLTNAKPLMDSYGWQPSTYVIWDQIGLSGRLTLTQYQNMQDISGWDVNCHSLTDADHATAFDNLTAAELENNVSQQQAIMAACGFQGTGSAYPKGQLTPPVRAMCRKYFSYVRGTYNKTLETWPPADIFNLRAVSSISPLSGGYSPTSISGAGGLIEKTATYKRWLILVFHKIIGNVTSCTNTTGTTYRIVYSDTSAPYSTGTSVTLQGFTPSGLNGTYTITATGTTGGNGYVEVSIPANPGNATVQGTALSATTDLDLAAYTAILSKINTTGVPVRTVAQVISSLGGTSTAAPITSTASYTMAPYDAGVLADSTSGAVTVTLPSAALCVDGRPRYVKDWKGQAATNNITIATTGGQTIDGASSLVISTAYGGYTLVSDGSNWSVTSLGGTVAIASGGTGQATAAAAYNALSPMTTLGDLEYESGANTASRLAGNTTSTKKFLTQTGTGSVSAAPGWNVISAGDMPSAVPVNNWSAADQGFITWNFDGPASLSGSNVALATAGTMYVMAMKLSTAATITNIVTVLTANGSTLTTGQCFAALYQGTGGTLLGTTSDQASAWGSGATKLLTMAISGGPVTAAAGTLYAGFWFNGTTGPAFWRTDGTQTMMNAGLAAATSRWGVANTSLTTTAPSTLGVISASGTAYWAAVS